MSVLTANSIPVIEGFISMPLTGTWVAELRVDIDTAFTAGQAITIASFDGNFTLHGSVLPSYTDEFLDVAHFRCVGGNGGLSTVIPPKFYAGAQLKDVLSYILGQANESLSSTVDSTFLTTSLPLWTLMRSTASGAIRSLINAVSPSSSWRILPDGTLWIGPESWPTATYDADLVSQDPRRHEYLLGLEAPSLLPGQAIDLGNISYIEHTIYPDKVRSRILMAG